MVVKYFLAGMLALMTASAWSADKNKTEKTWPYVKWVSAKAYTYNFFKRRYGVPYRVYSEKKGWSPYIRSVVPLNSEQAKRALQWTTDLRGDFYASKCPFPRHAVVFFNKAGKPVGSVNVCFECGDILVWPPLKRSKQEVAIEQKQNDIYYDKGNPKPDRLKTYDRVFVEWKKYFGRQLGMPVDFKNRLSIP